MKTLKLKAILIVVLAGFMSFSVKAQSSNSNVPQAVNTAFSNQYAHVQVKKWKMKGDTSVAEFSMNHRNYMAYYSPDGGWYKSERNIRHKSSLPIATQTFLKTSKYASWNVDRLAKITSPQHTMYLVQIDNHSGSLNDYEGFGSANSKMLYFNSHGELVKAY
jgi:hypothetical protein